MGKIVGFIPEPVKKLEKPKEPKEPKNLKKNSKLKWEV